MHRTMIQKKTFEFLSLLAANNDREWFQANKNLFEAAQQNMLSFADQLLDLMRQHDNIENESGKKMLYRIYKDTRFSKDKSPYKTHFGIRMSRATSALRGGYYFHLEPGNCFVGGGFFAPESDDLKRIREDIDFNYEEWNAVLANTDLVNTFGQLKGDEVKSAPKGYSKDHPAIDLLRKKQFLLIKPLSDAEVQADDFVVQLNNHFKALRPFFDYMSEVLTTDANGESLL